MHPNSVDSERVQSSAAIKSERMDFCLAALLMLPNIECSPIDFAFHFCNANLSDGDMVNEMEKRTEKSTIEEEHRK